MKFTILRLLTHSELGMFHAYRDGREGSKQRAINFDGDVVDRVFPSAHDSDKILIDCQCLDDETTIVEKSQWLKRQGKNWRLEGNCPKSSFFRFVEPGVLFAMVVDASTSPATAAWVVIPKDHPAHESIVDHGESARLDRSGMIALFGSDGVHCTHVLGKYFSNLFQKTELSMPTSMEQDSMAPDPVGLFDILASAGHRLPSAVADLVDNSISAGASKIEIRFPNPNVGGRWMSIRDDGRGMTYEELRKAMRVGNRRLYDGGDLGKFGYGLKGASWSQSDCLTVVTKAQNGVKSTMTWDKKHLATTGKWDVLEDPVAPKYETESEIPVTGTVVLLTSMRPPAEMATVKNVDPYTVEVTSVKDHLELVFHRYLDGVVPGRSKVEIYVNGELLEANNPMGHPLTKSYDPRTLMLNESDPEKKAVVAVHAFITPNEDELEKFYNSEAPEIARRARDRISLNGRWNETQGLYFYRLHRLIKWGGWDGMFAVDEKTKLLRVAVDFDRRADDPLKVNISKQEIKLPVNMSTNIKEILKEPRTEARARYKKVGRVGSKTSSPKPVGAAAGGPEDLSAPSAGGKVKPVKTLGGAIRIVDSGTAPWVRKKGFAGEHIEVTPQMPALIDLVRAIDGDPKAKIALSHFLLALEQADILKMLSNG